MRRTSLALLLLSGSVACGGKANENRGSGSGSSSGGNSADGTGGTGAVGGGANSGGSFGAGGAPTSGGNGGTAVSGGSGGMVFSGGTGAEESGGHGPGGAENDPYNTDCDLPYIELLGGPREDGPGMPLVGSCEEISDESLTERYKDREQKTPQGYFYDIATLQRWGSTCAESLDETRAWAIEEHDRAVTVSGTATNDYYHEVALCDEDSPFASRYRYRRLRCDYFDGTHLGPPPAANGDSPGFLGSLLWYMDNHNLQGSQLILSSLMIGSATDSSEICTIHTVYGDFGLCDEIQLSSQRISVNASTGVTIGEPMLVRTVQGECHSDF